MANSDLFKSAASPELKAPATDTVNAAGGVAYSMTDEHAIAQYVSTGTFSQTFYTGAEEQLDGLLERLKKVSPEFIAKAAVFGRQRGYMKDVPAFLVAYLAGAKEHALLDAAFPLVIDNGKMLRNFAQFIRSGRVGRKSFGSHSKRLIQGWLNSKSAHTLFRASVGNDPSLVDVIKMVHPKAPEEWRNALFAYLLGKEYKEELLPDCVKAYEAFKKTKTGEVPDVEFRLLTSLDLTKEHWSTIAKNAPWHMARMNLNTFQRHGVFDDPAMAKLVADKLRDKDTILKSKVFPYQLMTAYLNTEGVPAVVRDALQDAMEIATENVPVYEGQIHIAVDLSSSMSSPVMGLRAGICSKTTYRDVAALFASCIKRKNPSTEIIGFDDNIIKLDLNSRDSVITNSTKLAKYGGGGTACFLVLSDLNGRKAKGDLVVYVSDNMSWMDWMDRGYGSDVPTVSQVQWEIYKKRNPNAKLVNIDIAPYPTAQFKERDDVFNVGGFSDQVFEFLADVVQGGTRAGHWVKKINETELTPVSKIVADPAGHLAG